MKPRPFLYEALSGAVGLGLIFGVIAAGAFAAGFGRASSGATTHVLSLILGAGAVGVLLGSSLAFFYYQKTGVPIGQFFQMIKDFVRELGNIRF